MVSTNLFFQKRKKVKQQKLKKKNKVKMDSVLKTLFDLTNESFNCLGKIVTNEEKVRICLHSIVITNGKMHSIKVIEPISPSSDNAALIYIEKMVEGYSCSGHVGCNYFTNCFLYITNLLPFNQLFSITSSLQSTINSDLIHHFRVCNHWLPKLFLTICC